MDRVQECIDMMKKAYQIYIVLPAAEKERVDEFLDEFSKEEEDKE
jgi:hypothetical protein